MSDNGQKVFVPNYGAGIMSNINDDKKYDESKNYVSICFLLNNIDIYIPENELLKYKVRGVVSKEIAQRAIKIIKEDTTGIEKKWSKRYRENNDKIKSGDIFKICEVIRDLYYLKAKEMLPPGEKKILYSAEVMLASELTLVFDITMEESLYKFRSLR
jgi:CarD family transcriptional regulator